MKLALFNDFRLGVVKGDAIVDVMDAVKDIPRLAPQDLMRGLIERFEEFRPKLEKAASEGKGVPLSDVRIRPPLPKPGNIDCMAVNYMEDGTREAPAPINAFHKSPSGIIGNRATNVKAADAMGYIFG